MLAAALSSVLAFSPPASALPQGVAPPPASGVVNVRDFGAQGDGIANDTDAIQRAIDSVAVAPGRVFWETPIVYFPAGTYLISGTLERRDGEGRFTSGMAIAGEGRDRTTIKLADAAPGFGDPRAPKAMVLTSARLLDGTSSSGGKDYAGKGEGNDAYANYVENLTLDVGDKNPGAVALDYLANNIGAVRRVSLVGRAGSGAVGLALTRKWIGPALISDVTVDGFDVGIDVANTEYGVTMAHIRVRNARNAGLRNAGNLVAVDDLVVETASGPAVKNASLGGLVMVNGGAFSGSGGAAIENRGYLTLSGVKSTGFAALFPRSKEVDGDGSFGPDNKRLGDADWRLGPADAPAVDLGPRDQWVDITAFGARPGRDFDSTKAIRRAFQSGARTIVFPYGDYMVTDVIEIPETVRAILGMHATITVGDARAPRFDRRENGIFKVATGGDPLHIEKLTFDMTDRGGQLGYELTGDRVVAIEDQVTAGVNLVERRPTGGPLFVSNACCGAAMIAGPAPVWMRQFNSEGAKSARLRNDGSRVRVLGMKVEQEVTILENRGGGVSEIVGGFFYPVVPGDEPRPLVVNDGGEVRLGYAEEAFRKDATYDVHVSSAVGKRLVTKRMLPMRNASGARIVPFIADHAE
ncbi:glycoside hydrolase family 55 protein [Hansschlegelia quercus]|uniref:glycoside hydrolase family 55 protein n=1 Tax=Hansschlegelia quercus TaxID=2528245 RepID=UPI0013EF2886|nr:glycoside hydrolase family 55 protein [Hansschlegelia quercus]